MASEQTDENYLASLNSAEWFVIISRANLGFRYGPYTGPEAGAIMQQCQLEGIPCLLSANCGREFDWDVARDFGRGQPADWKPMEDAPQDGSTIMVDVGGVETRAVWWHSWEWWRELNEDGSVGKPVEPVRWRALSEEEKARG
ncbi:hypothetical protein HNO88_003004 [Novosphingobium chloroacetimidivorans]|uniref:Uncharacterized protein n=1 Tax=Novosphingobium chloroacetimidivorans TaxID=1428314 RepID=A0A7W7KBC3_9SPHN|nr:hypothetical protein [Novosphingobium chloroacetimidivorans]MBB4859675.1 hypothetical protein [Novosphingobium chloroacetimidivorans]